MVFGLSNDSTLTKLYNFKASIYFIFKSRSNEIVSLKWQLKW